VTLNTTENVIMRWAYLRSEARAFRAWIDLELKRLEGKLLAEVSAGHLIAFIKTELRPYFRQHGLTATKQYYRDYVQGVKGLFSPPPIFLTHSVPANQMPTESMASLCVGCAHWTFDAATGNANCSQGWPGQRDAAGVISECDSYKPMLGGNRDTPA
jgi:hypothetical protein